VEQLPRLVPWVYFIAAITFIFGLKGLSGPTTAQMGNRVAAAGMLAAVIATFLEQQVAAAWILVLPAIAIGTVIGFVGARSVPMTAMPQMVAIFNGAGGGAAALVSSLEFAKAASAETGHGVGYAGIGEPIAILLGLMIGAVSFSGSIIAFGKLQGIIDARAFKYAGQQIVTFGVFALMILAALAILAGALIGIEIAPGGLLLGAVAVLALIFGVALVMPIGGADMPVVISLLNAYTGLAVAMAGFSIGNQMLIVAGTLVGASGTILTRLMSKAMNRSLGNVLFGAFGAATATTAGAKTDDGRTFREVSAEDAAILLGYAQSVIIVPGYGLAVAQAQHNVRELADLLEAKGIDVKYAIHPVAGRMPGHMNVLLAEANVPYEKLFDMEQINEDFQRADVALVIGANDVTNPAARKDTSSPIYGMPILNVDQAQNIIVIKRSMKPGFAGIDNELYLDPKTGMLFGDAKEAVSRVVSELKKAA
jgi:NAD(P) transhydrogenase subunit beta